MDTNTYKITQQYNPMECDISTCIFFDNLLYKEGILTVYLIDYNSEQQKDARSIKIIFDTVEYFNIIDEGVILRIYEDSNFIGGRTLYNVINSNLIDFFHYLSYGIHSDINLMHFFIGTEAECIDILSQDMPIIEIKDL